MDIFPPEKRRRIMQSIRAKDTGPERIVRKWLETNRIRFRVYPKGFPGSPDIVLSQIKSVIFVHGCFWHRHKNCKYAYTPKTNLTKWRKKFLENRQRDKKVEKLIRQRGWAVIIIWECAVKRRTFHKKLEQTIMKGLFAKITTGIPSAKEIFNEASREAIRQIPLRTQNAHSTRLLFTMDKAEELYRKYEALAFSKAMRSELASAGSAQGWVSENFGTLESIFMSLFQSRKSRAGSTLQHAFAAVLGSLRIPYASQQVINGKPDFIIPSVDAYRRNPLRTRIVACKRTLRERWMQIIPESRDQGYFYLVTIDKNLTKKSLAQMTKKRVYVVVPSSLKAELYDDADNVITIDEFLLDTLRDLKKMR